MHRNKLLIMAFLIIAGIQIYIPAHWVQRNRKTITDGVTIKFKTEVVDPEDLFRGRYVELEFERNYLYADASENWHAGDAVFILLKTDSANFASYKGYSKHKPKDGELYVKAEITRAPKGPVRTMEFEYPFTKYFLEESLSHTAEQIYRDSSWYESSITYAVVQLYEGDAYLKDVEIGGASLKDLAAAKVKE